MTEENKIKNSTPPASELERLVMPLRMTEQELNSKILDGINNQPKYAGNSNMHLKGWDGAKLFPTVKALVLSIGIVELVNDEA